MPLTSPLRAPTDAELTALGETGAFVRDGLFGELAAQLRSAALAEVEAASLRPAGVSRGALREESVRGDFIRWVGPDDGPVWAAAHARFAELSEQLNQAAYLGLRRFDLQLAHYPPGARYVRHRDAFVGGPNRRLTAILYLNAGWRPEHGGALRLHLDAGVQDVAPELDRAVIFLSDRVEHEVLPTFAPRLALTAWYSP